MGLTRDKIRFFRECGRQGGKKRAKHLSPVIRSLIASRAARARWSAQRGKSDADTSIRLTVPDLNSPVFIEEILSDGSLAQWQSLYREVNNYPFGKTAQALEQVLTGPHLYGITSLWSGILKSLRSEV